MEEKTKLEYSNPYENDLKKSNITIITDFGLKTGDGYPEKMSLEELGNILEKTYRKNNKKILDEYKNSFIDGENIIYYGVASNGSNWIIFTNYANVFCGGYDPKIKNFYFWLTPEYILSMKNNSSTMSEKTYTSI